MGPWLLSLDICAGAGWASLRLDGCMLAPGKQCILAITRLDPHYELHVGHRVQRIVCTAPTGMLGRRLGSGVPDHFMVVTCLQATQHASHVPLCTAPSHKTLSWH